MKEIYAIHASMNNILLDLGLKKTVINGEDAFSDGVSYIRATYLAWLPGFVLEFAENLDEANGNLFEDGDLYPLSMGKEKLLAAFEKDIRTHYLYE